MEHGLEFLRERAERTLEQMRQVVVGQDEAIRGLLVAIFTGGHVLLEGVPGTAKTLMVRALARVLHLRFGRIQFTPDLMPSDIIGTHVYVPNTGEFRLRQGPIFTDLLLADEINRSPAKTQAALLEAMQEHRCTIDGEPFPLSRCFLVFATQNPIEYEGTYPLPEAQLDRFLVKIRVGYPAAEEEERILERYNQGVELHNVEEAALSPVLTAEEILRCREVIRGLRMDTAIVQYLRRLVTATREADDILIGAGPRAGIHLLLASKALAGLAGRAYVSPDDLQEMALPTLRHRIVLQPEAEASGQTTDQALEEILRQTPVPR
ncbi:MAG: MoxR family ATPase [Armatimonadetes bacterium]|nr:MoxR family ATPase [Armatimonadota bacterium]